jgi:hypothetical protein
MPDLRPSLEQPQGSPRLTTDGRGHQFLLWVTGTSARQLKVQRQDKGVWSTADQIGSWNNPLGFVQLPVGSSPTGAAAVAWIQYSGSTPVSLQLASFF